MGAVTPEEMEPELRVSVPESLAEVWVNHGLRGVRGTDYNSPVPNWERSMSSLYIVTLLI